jgi:hypothetical protein
LIWINDGKGNHLDADHKLVRHRNVTHHMDSLNKTSGTFLSALRGSEHRREPFDYWLLEDILPAADCDGVAGLPFPPPDNAIFDGRREANNTTRVYFTPQMQQHFPVCAELADAFRHPRVMSAIERTTGTDLTRGRLRIEYCQDVDGFWLEPHVDIPVKLFTMLVYLTDAPELHDAGTDIYDASPEHRLVTSAPYEWNAGLIFIPGRNTWHGFRKRPIRGVRKSIIVNYVAPEWRAVEELA